MLKNTCATYWRLVNKIFKQQIGRNVEVYIDDMLVKFAKVNNHIQDLQEMFNVLWWYQMKLNPQKCIFGVESGIFLGFMVTHKGIEANLEKSKLMETWRYWNTTRHLET